MSNSQVIGVLLGGLFGGGTLGVMFKAYLDNRNTATQVISDAWVSSITELRKDLDRLRGRVAHLEDELLSERNFNRILTTVLIENRLPIPERKERQ